jgi:hypothetical protein
VDELAPVRLPAGPVGHRRDAVVAGRDDHAPCVDDVARRLDAPSLPVAVDAQRLGAELDLQAVVPGIAFEVVDPLVAAREVTRAHTNVVTRLRGHPAESVEPQPVVARPPARRHVRRRFEDAAAESRLREQRRGGKARGTGAAYDNVRAFIRHRMFIR